MTKILDNTSSLQDVLDTINDLDSVYEPNYQSKTVTPSTSVQEVVADNTYDALEKVTVNAMPTATQATPSISVSSAGLITASSTQTAGYVASGTKSATKQLTTQAAKTVTPTKSSQTAVASGIYTTGTVTVAAIPSSYITTTDATAIAREICQDKTAYVNGSKVTGTGLVYKTSTLTGWYGSYTPTGGSAGKYIRLLSCSGKTYSFLSGWVNFVVNGTTTQVRFGGGGSSSVFTGTTSQATTTNPGIHYYNGYAVLQMPTDKITSLGIGTPSSIEVVLYYRQF